MIQKVQIPFKDVEPIKQVVARLRVETRHTLEWGRWLNTLAFEIDRAYHLLMHGYSPSTTVAAIANEIKAGATVADLQITKPNEVAAFKMHADAIRQLENSSITINVGILAHNHFPPLTPEQIDTLDLIIRAAIINP